MVGQKKSIQKEFLFDSPPRREFISAQSRPRDLGQLPVTVLELNIRARRWLHAHDITTIDQLIEAKQKKIISSKCLDNQVRIELQSELRKYWTGKKFKYILAVNFLDHGVGEALSLTRVRRASIKQLSISPALQAILHKKKIQTIGQLLLHEELKWRNPRSLGNILVNEILIALSIYLNKLASSGR
ncbi:MAG: hypothetical protein U9N73_08250 [Candidatus Auribacterota bacterium]|nr:hypothetical protein [Candidatus Auribacterota bacterium]